MQRPVTASAAGAMLVYVIGAAIIPDSFPFSRIHMYASLAGEGPRNDAAIPIALVNGKRSSLVPLTDFRGPPADDILPDDRCRTNGVCGSFPSSDPRDRAMFSWVDEHRTDDRGPGPHDVVIAYLRVDVTPDGSYDHELVPVWEGTAWPR